MRIGALVLIVCLSLAALTSAFTAYEVRGLTDDLAQARSRLPASVGAQLPSNTGGILAHNEVTLVSYDSGLAKGTTVLIATAPSHRFSSILSISPGVRIGSGLHKVPRRHRHHHPKHPRHRYKVVVGTPLRDMTTRQAITALRAAGIPVTHVALIQAKDVGPLVDAVGGITIDNRHAFTAQVGGQQTSFPKGRLHLDGSRAAAYVEAATRREQLGTAENSALVALIHALLAQTGLAHLKTVGDSMARATATDLSPADVIGLVDMRLRGGTLIECRLAGAGNLADPGLASIVNQALGRIPTRSPACATRRLAPSPIVPPAAIVTAVQHYGWQLFVGITIVLAAIAIGLAAILRASGPRTAYR